MKQKFTFQGYWASIGYLMLFTVIVLSLVKIQQPFDIAGADKFEHILAYGALMYWWGMLQPSKQRFWMLLLPLMGLTLEWMQTFTPYRFMEWKDVIANLSGVALAALLLKTPARKLLLLVDRKLADRLNSHRS